MINLTQEQIMKNWGEDNSNTPVVSVKCITYNHEKYIAQALDGFLMQKTIFPFEVIVHDDASTDKTADIIREYEAKFPKIIKPIYETENQYSKHDGSLSKIVNEACKGKYIAFCEGDDYWIDENKLQTQVDFLEKHHAYGMCYTKARCYFNNSMKFGKRIGKNYHSYESIFIYGNCIPTLTVCIRTEVLNKYNIEVPFKDRIEWVIGDLPQWLWILKNSKIKFIRKVTGVYRILDESASHSKNEEKMKKYNMSSFLIRKYFSEKYNEPNLLEQYNIKDELDKFWTEKERQEFNKTYKVFSIPNFQLIMKHIITTNSVLWFIYNKLK